MAYGQFLHGMNDWERRSRLHSDETDLMIQWDQIEKATAAGHLGGRGTYLILAPPGWMYDAVEWRTFRVVHSDEVDHPMLVIDPHWRRRHDESLQRRAES